MHTILIVEDEPEVCDNIAEILTNNSYKVIKANNGLDAMQSLDKKIPDLIVSDIVMPGVDGLQLLEFIQNSKRLSQIPFVFLTAKTSNDDIRQGMLQGADDYLTKPFRAKDLLKTVEVRLKKKERYKEQVDRIRENIAFSIQHELRTPLTPILGYSEFMIEDSKCFTADEIEKMGISIKQSALRLRCSVEKFILFSNVLYDLNLMNKARDTNPSTGSLDELIRSVVLQECCCDKSKNEILYDIEEDKLKIDEPYFLICVKELLENALKFSKPGSYVKITGRNNNDFYELYFENYDSWLSAEQIDNISILNKQCDPSKRGSGLGLAIVKKIVEFFEGDLEILSEKDKYVRVIIRLSFAD